MSSLNLFLFNRTSRLLNISRSTLLCARNKMKDVELPKYEGHKAGAFRRKVHYPEKYTVQPLKVTNLAGRDPATGRLVIKALGGGIKRKYHWIDWLRDGPEDGPPLEEKVIQIMIDYCRSSHIALIASGDKLKYYLATEHMQAGDIIRTSRHIPRIPVFPKEGDAYPLGALHVGTLIHNIELQPGRGGYFVHAAGCAAEVIRKLGDRVVVKLPSKQEFDLSERCLATVGRLSNVIHGETPIGSPQRLRELGFRPRSGLWQRKDGRFGRKIKPLPPVRRIDEMYAPEKIDELRLTLNMDMHHTLKLY